MPALYRFAAVKCNADAGQTPTVSRTKEIKRHKHSFNISCTEQEETLSLGLEYSEAPDVKALADEAVDSLDMFHVVPQFVYCYRSKGSKSRRIIARIHGLSPIWQESLRRPAAYVIEVISENYDHLSTAEKEKTVIHELLHIPKGFTGGFRPHKGYVEREKVERLHSMLMEKRAEKQ